MRSIAEQNVLEMGGHGSVLSRQKRDHVRLHELLRRLADEPVERQGAILIEIYRLVFPHAFAEESVLWPVMRRVLPDGEALTLQVELEHQQINRLVAQLERMVPGSPGYQQVLDRIFQLLDEDVRDEEDKLLPRLQDALTAAQLRWLGIAWEVVRMIAPTRAHPIVARRPPGNVISALPLSLLDRSRDLVDKRLERGAAIAAPALRALSSVLKSASHGVERLPGLRLGEHPRTREDAWPGKGGRAFAALTAAAALTMVILAARPRTA
jgi:hypothetical protein